MTEHHSADQVASHHHVFLGADHAQAERRTWIVIALCSAMMVAEIVGGVLFGSLALVVDGLHMSTHAGALLLAALAYTFARRYAHDRNFTFGTGKFGDLAGYSSAIVLAMIALLIGYEAVSRLLNPVPISFNEAIPIALLGLVVNVVSAWLLSGGHHHHVHGHAGDRSHDHDHSHHGHDEEPRQIELGDGLFDIEIFEKDVPPRFRIRLASGATPDSADITVETVRPDGSRYLFSFEDHGDHLQSRDEIPEPHQFAAIVRWRQTSCELLFEEHHDHAAPGHHHRDNNMRAAVVHVMADAAVSVLVIGGLVAARAFGLGWMDPLAGLVGGLVIANWSFGLIRDTGGILLDRTPDPRLADKVRKAIEGDGDKVTDLHLWRLGPGHLGAIVAIATTKAREAGHYRRRLAGFADLSHLTVEVQRPPS